MDLPLVIALVSVGIALGALVVSWLAFKQNAKHYPKPVLIDESRYEKNGDFPFIVKLRNVGNAPATDVRLTMRLYLRGSQTEVRTMDRIEGGDYLYYSCRLSDVERLREVRFDYSWRQGPNFGKRRVKRAKVTQVSFADVLWRRFAKANPEKFADMKITEDIGIVW